MHFRFAALALGTLLLAGCATAPKQVAYDREASGVKTLEVLPIRRSEIELMILNNPGYSFGLIGATIAEANRIPKRNKLREYAEQSRLDHVAELKAMFEAEAAKKGYVVRWPSPLMESDEGPKAKREGNGLRKSYPAASGGADALLDLNFGMVGYVAAGSGDNAPYRPTAVVVARMVDRDGQRVLFSDMFVYNNVFNLQQAVTIEPDPAYVYPDFDDLDAAGPKAIDGLRAAVRAVVSEVARQL